MSPGKRNPAAVGQAQSAGAAPRSRRILVAEDNPADQALLRMQLGLLGFAADIAADGREAFARWEAGSYAALLTDCLLPGLDGLALARAVRAAERKRAGRTPIIGLTAQAGSDALRACRDAGMDATVSKPVGLENLRRLLAHWLPDAPLTAHAGTPPEAPPQAPGSGLDAGCLSRSIGLAEPAQVRALLDTFIASARSELAACRSHLEARDGTRLALAMHKLKSSARAVGALRFAVAAERLEAAARRGGLEPAAALLIDLEEALNAIAAADPPMMAGRRPAADGIEAGDILAAMRRDELAIHYQPIVDARTLRPVGIGALARWEHGGEAVAPERFIAAAERHGVIGPLSELLVTKALIGAARLAAEGFSLPVTLKLSARWLPDANLPGFLLATLQATGASAAGVVAEVTAQGVAADWAAALGRLARLPLKGIKVSLDAISADSACLDHLRRTPSAEVALDRGSVRRAMEAPAARGVLASCITLARRLDLATVAVGVETQGGLDLMRELGCDRVQGWQIAPAMPMEPLIGWLRDGGRG